ncbi:MAG: nickel-responsive transcriptional regulator NikR [Planctomycetes bacterium]|nr:nickel-responsive transcriptional regulator NikR [Planctomycetota bacterium]
MAKLVRFGVSLEKDLLDDFDRFIREGGFTNRSQGLRSLIREQLVKREWLKGKEVAGTITLVYDHHRRELVTKLISVQHDFHDAIVSTQHIHLDHNNCLEIVVVKGKPNQAQELLQALKATKGVKHCVISMATTGHKIP